MDAAKRRAWQALELGPVWTARESTLEKHDAPFTEAATPTAAVISSTAGSRTAAALDWTGLQAAVAGCTACGLCQSRTRTVFGTGSLSAKWLVVGEAPGADEDASGEPFVGQAGRLLDSMLASIGLDRGGDAFIANLLKCRPPGNRNPLADEVAACEPYLARQVELLRPRVIVALGRFAAQSLLRTDSTIANLRGRVHRYTAGGHDVPLVVTYHPAYLLRSLPDKSRAWADLCLARAVFDAVSL